MVDIHTHIIPNVDDGSKSVEDTFTLFKEAVNAGFTDVVLTPHYIKDYYDTNTEIREFWVKSIQDTLNKLEIPINVYVGNEIYICEDMDRLIFENKVSCLNNSKYVLFELPMNLNVKYLDQIIFKIFNLGKVPIIAHPERYSFIQNDIPYAKKLHEKGVLFQSNYGSILDLYGKEAQKTLEKLLRQDLINFMASDVHRPDTIYSVIEESKNKIEKIVGSFKLEKLTTINPRKIIMNENIDN